MVFLHTNSAVRAQISYHSVDGTFWRSVDQSQLGAWYRTYISVAIAFARSNVPLSSARLPTSYKCVQLLPTNVYSYLREYSHYPVDNTYNTGLTFNSFEFPNFGSNVAPLLSSQMVNTAKPWF